MWLVDGVYRQFTNQHNHSLNHLFAAWSGMIISVAVDLSVMELKAVRH